MAGAAKLLETLAAAVPLAKQATKNIRAWHASPHDFDRFDLSKIGTGQGAASYGHGIYAAESPKVSGVGGEYWKEFAERAPKYGPEAIALNFLKQNEYDRIAAAASARKFSETFPRQPNVRDDLNKAADMLEGGKKVGPRVYEIDIKARPEQFLDWDKPLAQQPAIFPILRNQLGQGAGWRSGESVYQALGGARENPEWASKTLRDAGIPGIRYLDAASRNQPAAIDKLQRSIDTAPNPVVESIYRKQLEKAQAMPVTSNYVLFDDKLIDILKKYLVPGVVGTGAIGAAGKQEQ